MTHLIRAMPFAIAGFATVAWQSTVHRVTPQRVLIVAYDYGFDAPESIPAGVTTLHFANHGTELHHVALVRLDAGHTAGELIMALGAPGPKPSWATFVGGPQAVAPGMQSTATVDLAPGNYVLTCLIPASDGVPHFMKGMSRTLTVSGPYAPSALPHSTVTISLVDYAFQLSQPLIAGHEVIRVQNVGTQPHEIFLARLAPGATVEDLPKWADARQGPPPFEAPSGGVTPIAAGGEIEFTMDLTPGEYGLYCFISDVHDGKPHFMHGMMQQITVAAPVVARR